MKDTLVSGHTLGRQITAVDLIIVVTHIDAVTGWFSDDAVWKPAADEACAQQIANISAWINHHIRFGNASAIIDWTQKKNPVSDAEATIT